MKPILFIISFILTTLAIPIWADIDLDSSDIGSEDIKKPSERTPYSFETNIDIINSSKISKGFFKDDEVSFAQAEAELGLTFYYCPTYTEGARAAIAYDAVYVGWDNNPWFGQEHYETLSLTLAGFTGRLNNWFWRSQFTVGLDTREWKSNYTKYDILLWGRYNYCTNIGLHVGFWVETGLNLDRVYPVIGFDWNITKRLKLNLIYPVNMSLVYDLAKKWSLAFAGRIFNVRNRIGQHECHSGALMRYQNNGAEFAVNYNSHNISANLHVGCTLGGRYRIANTHNKDAHTYKLCSSAYIGGEMDVKF